MQHVAAKDRLRQQRESDQALKAAKLEAVDRLLWQTDFLRHQGSTQSPSGMSNTPAQYLMRDDVCSATQPVPNNSSA